MKSLLGTNLPAPVEYHGGCRMFIDLMRTANPAGSYASIDGGNPGNVDVNGWATGDHGKHVTSTPTPGRLKFWAKGRVTSILIRASSDKFVLNYDAAKDETTGHVDITSRTIGISLQIKGERLGKMSLLRPGYDNADAVFTDEFVKSVEPFGHLRWMETQLTNFAANDIKTFGDMPSRDDATYSRRGVPLADIILLANRTGQRPWVSVPANLNDDGVLAFAKQLKTGLNPGIIPIIELDNESWGTHFRQGQDNANAAVIEKDVDLLLRSNPWGDPNGDWNVWRWNRHLKRVIKLNSLLLAAYGNRDAYRLMLNEQYAHPDKWKVSEAYLKARNLKLADVVHGIAIAPYADGNPNLCGYWDQQPFNEGKPNATNDEYFASGGINTGASYDQFVKRWEAIAETENVRFYTYEGGINLMNAPHKTEYPAKRTIQTDPRMEAAVAAYIDNWPFKRARFDDDRVFSWFHLQVQWKTSGPAANFGAVEDVADTTGPKYQGLAKAAKRYPAAVKPPVIQPPIVTPPKPVDPPTKPVDPVKPNIAAITSMWGNVNAQGTHVYAEFTMSDGRKAAQTIEIK